ncbi:MAG: alpha-1,6-mannosyltransferase, partial [Sporothrix thermara]
MSLSRSPSPSPDGGWSSPGLNINNSGRSSPAKAYSDAHGSAPDFSRSRTSKYPSFSTQNQGFFTRHMRQLSSSLPRFNVTTPTSRTSSYADKDNNMKGRWDFSNSSLVGRVRLFFARMTRTTRIRLAIVFAVLAAIYIFYHS